MFNSRKAGNDSNSEDLLSQMRKGVGRGSRVATITHQELAQ
ncbi:MAG: hypothetical protein AAFR77_01790 [Cyanobacteria bacterium J06631_2]